MERQTKTKIASGVSTAVIAAALVIAPSYIGSREAAPGGNLAAYQDITGVWTDCYGSTVGVKKGDVSTKEKCIQKLQIETAAFSNTVANLITVPVTVERYVATLDFAYNVGTNAFASSTLLRKLNAGDTLGACQQFMRWTMLRAPLGSPDDLLDGRKDGYKNCALPGLRAPCGGITKRRQDERDMCMIGLEKPKK